MELEMSWGPGTLREASNRSLVHNVTVQKVSREQEAVNTKEGSESSV